MTDWIVITAPGSDIGQVLTEHLLEQGYGIIGMGRANSMQYLASLEYERLYRIECDYTDEESMEHAFTVAREQVKQIAGLIHLVGGSLVSTPLEALDLNTFHEVMAVNTYSAFLAGREAVRWMKEGGGGNIIFFGSTTGIEPIAGKLAYGAAKAAVHNLTLSFALEGSAYEIITNTIAPAYVMTKRHQQEIKKKAERSTISEEEIMKELRQKNPLHRVLQTTELIPSVELLLQTTVIQGQILQVDLGQIRI